MHTKMGVLNALLLTRFTACSHSRRPSCKPKDVLLDPEGSLSICLPTPAHEAVEIAIVDKGLGKKRDQYFIFMIALDAASSFVFF